jgi:trans-2,3-dihydro-3-hydroxyanthranilate isomerase
VPRVPVDAPLSRLSRFDPLDGAGEARAYVLLDVFTDAPLTGNQLAVFTDPQPLDAGAMQRIALELRLSESVFVLLPEQGGDARIRIFTPTAELPFAGHPVLGSAILIAAALELAQVTLETAAGAVSLSVAPAQPHSAEAAFAWMRQPLPSCDPMANAAELLDALGVQASGLPVEIYTNGPRHAFVELVSEQAVAELQPDMAALGRLDLQANCFAGADSRWKTRMFAPSLGVPEDPATGSAAGPLALHLARHGRIAFGQQIEISQGAELGRPSRLYARALGSRERLERVEVGGSAVVVGRGELLSR